MNNKICKISLFSLIAVCSLNMPASAKINVKGNNRSYADAYNQVAAIRYQQELANSQTVTTASDTGTLPVAVTDRSLAESILNNTAEGVTISDLERCSMIYPGGVFKWAIPESGVRRNNMSQCVAVVELINANTQAVLATTTVAAGDTIKCNVDSFPEYGLSLDLKNGKIEVPADAAPTMDDVERVMNEEQKQNAGFKIAAATIISGLAGNMLAPKQTGDSKLLGTSSTQIQDTAIGAVAGAGIMAASVYSGKVAGDTIKSTAVNAASGMVVGNMLAGANGSESVLATTKCKTPSGERDCIIGNASYIGTSSDDEYKKWLDKQETYVNDKVNCPDGESKKAVVALVSTNRANVLVCRANYTCCNQVKNDLVKIYVGPNYALDSLTTSQISSIKKYQISPYSEDAAKNNYVELSTTVTGDSDNTKPTYYPISVASVSTGVKEHAFAVFDNLPAKPFGYKMTEWSGLLSRSPTYYKRNLDGTVGEPLPETKTIDNTKKTLNFEPSTRDASDGSLVDLSNEARAKGTLVGTAAGGALGGFAGYQGAKSEIADRWTAAVRAYNDSLSNFACVTGGRFLATYNSYLEIPELKKEDEQ